MVVVVALCCCCCSLWTDKCSGFFFFLLSSSVVFLLSVLLFLCFSFIFQGPGKTQVEKHHTVVDQFLGFVFVGFKQIRPSTFDVLACSCAIAFGSNQRKSHWFLRGWCQYFCVCASHWECTLFWWWWWWSLCVVVVDCGLN